MLSPTVKSKNKTDTQSDKKPTNKKKHKATKKKQTNGYYEISPTAKSNYLSSRFILYIIIVVKLDRIKQGRN